VSRNGRRVKIFSALEVANICGVVNQTAINWIRNGHLKAFTTPGGQYRIYAKDLAAFLEKRGMGASEEALHVIMANANWDTLLIAGSDTELSGLLKGGIEKDFPGMEVIQTFDGFETGRKLTERKPGFILLDGDFPGVDCQKLITTIKNDLSFGKPFIMVLGEFSSDPGNEASAVFPKPPDLNQITAAIRGFERQIDSAVTA
jgi:excisionase family DNA binding protein